MNDSLRKRWLERATEDLAVAQLVLQEEYAAHACFLSQQCCEKSLKAYLLVKTNSYPRTHKLVDLLTQCAQIEATFRQFITNVTVIDQYYIPTRYPDSIPGSTASGLPDEAEAQEAITTAETILQFVTKQLS